MKQAKDLFSKQAAAYAAFRPVYPQALYDFIFNLVKNFDTAWDCATGNGQVATRLAERFKTVYATDISRQQLENAPVKDNILYRLTRAEETPFPDSSFDLITVGAALHWFDFQPFFKEVARVAKDGAIFAAWVYAPFRANIEIDSVLDHYYRDVIGQYWDPERKYVDDGYRTIPFPFEEIKAPALYIETEWDSAQFKGFLNSWSSTQHYINKNGTDPVSLIAPQLDEVWKPGEKITIKFPLFTRAGIVRKNNPGII